MRNFLNYFILTVFLGLFVMSFYTMFQELATVRPNVEAILLNK